MADKGSFVHSESRAEIKLLVHYIQLLVPNIEQKSSLRKPSDAARKIYWPVNPIKQQK